jgi:hypothetical protein
MTRRSTAKSELDRLVIAVAELKQELVTLQASRRCSCPACTGGPLALSSSGNSARFIETGQRCAQNNDD